MNRKTGRTAVLAAAIMLAGCASSPVPTYYSLDLGVALPAATANSPSVSIGLAGLPHALDRPQMVSRKGYEVRVSEQSRWAEPLRSAIPRVLANEIGGLLNSTQVLAGTSLLKPDYRVLLDVQRFEVVSDRGVEIDILWRIDGKGGSQTGRSQLREPVAGDDIPSQVEAQRRGLSRVAAQIAEVIKEK